MALLQQSQFFSNAHKHYNLPPQLSASSSPSNSPPLPTRRALSLFLASATCNFSGFPLVSPAAPFNNVTATRPTPTPLPVSDFVDLPNSGGVRALDLRIPDQQHAQTPTPSDGDRVVIHYYARLAAKQGWRFDSTYDHKDDHGDPVPFQFVLGSGKVIAGIESAVRTMKVGGIRRVIIPPSQGYQNTSQEPLPPNFFDRQRLFTTIFNPTRLANGEGSTLGTLIFDIELISLRHYENSPDE